MRTFHAVWLFNVTGVDGSERQAFARDTALGHYREDDEFVVGWKDDIEAERPEDVPKKMFDSKFCDGRPSRWLARRLRAGDVVLVEELAFVCNPTDFRLLPAAPRRIRTESYIDYMATHARPNPVRWDNAMGRRGKSAGPPSMRA